MNTPPNINPVARIKSIGFEKVLANLRTFNIDSAKLGWSVKNFLNVVRGAPEMIRPSFS